MWILWTIVIGFVAGVLAKFITPGDATRLHPYHSPGNRRRIRHDLPWPSPRLVPRRTEHGIYWGDTGRYPYPIGVGRHRIKEANSLS